MQTTTKQQSQNEQILVSNLGRNVTIENRANYDSEYSKTYFNFGGKLEYEEDYKTFYVRVGEDYVAGTMGISFSLSAIDSLEKRVYGELRIVLK